MSTPLPSDSHTNPQSNARTVLVTGGTGQLGRIVVGSLLRSGFRVHVPIFNEAERPAFERALAAADANSAALQARLTLHVGIDLADVNAVNALYDAISGTESEGVDALLHLAGGFHFAKLTETDPDVWHRMIAMNATSGFLAARAAFPAMLAKGWGRIVMVSAIPVLQGGRSGMSAYGASKAAVLALVEALSREGAPHGITVNAILPSTIDTPGNREAMPDANFATWVTPDEIAGVLHFLLSDAAQVVTGAALTLRRD